MAVKWSRQYTAAIDAIREQQADIERLEAENKGLRAALRAVKALVWNIGDPGMLQAPSTHAILAQARAAIVLAETQP